MTTDASTTAPPPDADADAVDRAAPPRPPVVSIAVSAVLVLLIGLGVAWLRGRDDPSAIDELGSELPVPIDAPALTLFDTDGAPIALPDLFDDHVTLVYLGYLNCPDACPITMDVLSRALATRTAETRQPVQVVFVTTDPARDAPDEIRAYLDRFDASFIGLTAASDAELAALQDALLVPGAVLEPADEDGNYLVGHATSVFVFDDGVAHQRYPFGTRQSDWERIIQEHADALGDAAR
ncbi:MAG: SCO family protein [Ilumatobacteraceae bacterium]|nr:SCO family protein [Acidimicrobiales bacterium]MCB9394077.1 SCO family protein [Acidimicrobiaceae bacterium]